MQERDFSLISSELSPAVVAVCRRSTLTLFGNLSKWGVGAPTRVAFVTAAGVQVKARREGENLTIPAASLTEAWMLIWFRGAKAWEWDAPWLVVWQRKPTSLTLGETGLTAKASVPLPVPLGDVVLLPLHGLYKPKTEAWGSALPEAVLTKCRFWARTLRRYPVANDETFRLEGDAVVVKNAFTFRTIDDDWKTPATPFAPLSPTLALAHLSKKFPMRVSAPVHDPDLCTGFGPYVGVQNATGYTLTFPLLRYLTETEKEPEPDRKNPIVRKAHDRLEQMMAGVFSAGDGKFHQDFGDPQGDDGNTCWALMSVQYYCRALPYVKPQTVAMAKQRLRRYFDTWVLQEKRFKPFKGKLLLFGPGIGAWGGYDDAGKFSSNTLVSLWAYARYTDDWELIRERWSLIQKLFITPRECSWRSYGRQSIAEMGDEAAPALAMARLAGEVNDKDTFAYAAYVFVRELVHHAVKMTGEAYFAARHPIHQKAPLKGTVYPTNVLGDMIGWDRDGAEWQTHAVDRQHINRWVRFGDPDVARFHRECFATETRREMDALLIGEEKPPRQPNTVDDSHIRPSRVRLRSLLCNDTPEQLAKITPPDAPIYPDGAVAAYCMAFLRVCKPVEHTEIIPQSEIGTTPWKQGIERDVPESEPVLCVTVTVPPQGTTPPALTWWGWKPPQGGERWSFGEVFTDAPLRRVTQQRLSASTVAWHFTSTG
jgi:hypothetical protein